MNWVRRAAPWSIINLAGQLQALRVPQHPRPGPARGRRARPPDQRHRKRALFPNLEGRPTGPALCLGRGFDGAGADWAPGGCRHRLRYPQASWAAPSPVECARHGYRSTGAPGLTQAGVQAGLILWVPPTPSWGDCPWDIGRGKRSLAQAPGAVHREGRLRPRFVCC